MRYTRWCSRMERTVVEKIAPLQFLKCGGAICCAIRCNALHLTPDPRYTYPVESKKCQTLRSVKCPSQETVTLFSTTRLIRIGVYIMGGGFWPASIATALFMQPDGTLSFALMPVGSKTIGSIR